MNVEALVFVVHVISVPLDLIHRGLKSISPFKSTTLCLEHRAHTRKHWFEKAFKSGKEVLLLTIMSEHTVKEIRPFLEMAKATKTHVRCLTWYPEPAPEAVESFRNHLGEAEGAPERTLRQVQEAWIQWKQIEKEYPAVLQVARYKSSPTMGAVLVKNKSALVELIPYHAQPGQRPALILSHWKDRQAFRFFSEQLEALWNDAMQAAARTSSVH